MAANNSASGKAHGENRPSFEENFSRLQEVVTRLSEGNLTLQEALSAYEEGMSLADRCAKMLDEAELRVTQVSDRALRAGSASLSELDADMRGQARGSDNSLIAIEIESYESTLVFDEAPSGKSAPSNQTSSAKESKPSPRPIPQPLLDELDPLFDEED